MKQTYVDIESLHEISYIIRAIDGNYISITTPNIDHALYYYKNDFKSILLQDLMNCQCKFWAGRMIGHYSKNQKLEKKTMNEIFVLYKRFGDAIYSMHPWFYSPFKEEKTSLSREKKNIGILFSQLFE